MAGLLLGCGEPADIPEPEPAPPSVDLSTGKVDPKLVGVWKNAEESYAFSPDGTFTLHYDRMEATGPSSANKVRKVGDLSGKWTANQQFLLLAVEKGENSKHKMVLLLSDGDKKMELRPTYRKDKPGVFYTHVSNVSLGNPLTR
jgi:hypothetical protein